MVNYKKIMEGSEFKVECFDNGQAALDFLDSHHQSVVMVIADYRMPYPNGIEFRQKMVENSMAQIPFAMISAHITKDLALAGLELKICGFINKLTSNSEFNLQEFVRHEASERISLLSEQLMLVRTFIDEAGDIVEELESEILDLEQDLSRVDHVFRLVHTVKGGSGVLNNPDFSQFLHYYEEILTELKNGQRRNDQQTICSLLTGFDALRNAVTELEESGSIASDFKTIAHSFKNSSDPQSTSNNTASQQAAKDGGTPKSPDRKKAANINIPVAMLDDFLHLSGEITVIRNMVKKQVAAIHKELPASKNVSELSTLLDEMNKINSTMQTRISDLRKVPVNTVVKTLPRIVRDLCKQLKKQVELTITGNELRIDNRIAQDLSGCMIHIIRNSVDHGIEALEKRLELGKPEDGKVCIDFKEDKDEIVVTVSDDGGGINTQRLRQKALDKQILPPDELKNMSDGEANNLIFHAGFSTAEKVTDVSGRGVGMDMVKNTIRDLGGDIEVVSTMGEGSQFNIRIPIPKSVHIIGSLIVISGGQTFAIPLDSISRLMTLSPEHHESQLRKIQDRRVLRYEDRILPLIDLNESLQLPAEPECEETNIIIVRGKGCFYGLVVDEICDIEEIVLKPLEPSICDQKVFAGETFMADGRVGMILDIDGLALHRQDLTAAHDSPGILGSTPSSKTAPDTEKNTDDYILFRLNSSKLFAVNLDIIYRLERLDPAIIHQSVDSQLVHYRDDLIPYIQLADTLGISTEKDLSTDEMQDAIIVSIPQHGLVAFNIGELLDIQEIKEEPSQLLHHQVGISGCLSFENSVYYLIDRDFVLGSCSGELHRKIS